jgi:monoamine oxidase
MHMTAQSGERTSSEHLDFAIVGAGVSGLYTAWRLLLDNPARTVRIFEMSERYGGRLLTWRPDGGLQAELGGMRFFEQQQLVWNLLPQLGFSPSDIIKFWVSGKGLRLLLRGRSTPLTVENPAQRYDVPLSDQGMQAADILEHAVQQVLRTPENWAVIEKYLDGQPPTDRRQWDEIKPYLCWRGQPLWHIGFWNLLSDLLNSETYQFICDAFGYYSLAANWNAAEAMQSVFLDFTQNPDYQTLVEGYGALPERLADRVTQAGGEIVLNTRLVGFDRSRHDDSWTLSLQGPHGPQKVDAGHLVLAMPRRSLELLTPSASFNLAGSPDLRRLVESVQPFPAFKMLLFYESRWWERWGIERGRSVCDLPIRQTYYFAPRPQPEGTPDSAAGLLMASYSDAAAVGFWRGMVPPQDEWESGRSELREAMSALARSNGLLAAAETVPEPPPDLHKASPAMLYHAKCQLALLHDISPCDIPDPVVGAFADWGLDPFGGGWNFWEPNVDVQQTMRDIKVPLGHNQRVYVVGEAYSGEQGWVEGALTSAEVTLQTHIGLSRPAWLPSTYYLGW